MGTEPPAQLRLQPTVVDFANGREATLVQAEPRATAPALIAALGLEGRVGAPALVVSSGAAERQADAVVDRARDTLVGALARIGAVTAPTVLDCGAGAGVPRLTGAARAAAPEAVPVLLGVLEDGITDNSDATPPLEEHHTHFVVADSRKEDGETGLLLAVASELGGQAPKALLLVGGDESAKAQALWAVERGWPTIVIAGTGGAADRIAIEWQSRHRPPESAISKATPKRFRTRLPRRLQHKRAPKLDAIGDSSLRRIVGDGRLWVSADGDPSQLARQIAWELQDEPVLKDAWKTFAAYDALAVRDRTTFERFQNSILALGVLATLLALLASATKYASLHWAAVAAPIVASTVIALANRRAAGKRWVVLRAAAESLKAEIYRYRTRTGMYADDKLPDKNPKLRGAVLVDRMATIDDTLMHTDATNSDLPSYTGPLPPEMYGASRDDDGLCQLDAPSYVRLRLGDQVAYFEGRVKTLDRRREWLQAVGVGAAGAGAILAAAGVAVWVGLTTAISGAALSYLGYLQVDNTIVTYNQAKTKLRLLDLTWKAQSVAGPNPDAFEQLVTEGEAVLGLELGGWVRQMTQAVDRLQAEQAHAGSAGAHQSAPRGATPSPSGRADRRSRGGTAQPARDDAAADSDGDPEAESGGEAAAESTEDAAT